MGNEVSLPPAMCLEGAEHKEKQGETELEREGGVRAGNVFLFLHLLKFIITQFLLRERSQRCLNYTEHVQRLDMNIPYT